MKINTTQLEISLNMQNTINKNIADNWVELGWDYMRATMIDVGEAIERHGWKWWKQQEKDLSQLQMEVIEIWHCYLSHYLQKNLGDIIHTRNIIISDWKMQENKGIIFDNSSYHVNQLNTLEKFDLLIGLASSKRTNLNVFFSLCKDCDLTWNDLFSIYIKKNTLNIFRQQHGYNNGSYEKFWFDKEDNIFFIDVADKLDPTQDSYADDLWNNLETLYIQAINYRLNKNKV
jgi:hypothetical protein